jgi:hypothetical protein
MDHVEVGLLEPVVNMPLVPFVFQKIRGGHMSVDMDIAPL